MHPRPSITLNIANYSLSCLNVKLLISDQTSLLLHLSRKATALYSLIVVIRWLVNLYTNQYIRVSLNSVQTDSFLWAMESNKGVT
jgi:hypothetical protein